MNEGFDPGIAEIATLCRRHRVVRLDLFGSAVGERFRAETSDVDLLVTFEDMGPEERAEAYFGLWEDLENLFGRRVELVTDRSVVNPYLKASIEATRELLFAA